jgi:hypothetical protein
MKRPTRRSFLRNTTMLFPTLGALGRTSAEAQSNEALAVETGPILSALAEVVLPTTALELARGKEALRDTLAAFVSWSDGFEPLAELDHPYLSSDEIRYGPPDPRPAWLAQLEGLQTEAQKRHERSFAALDRVERRAILEHQLPAESRARLPHAASAGHIAVALLAWFYATSEANDLCYGRKIGRYECRGLPSARDLPQALTETGEGDQN